MYFDYSQDCYVSDDSGDEGYLGPSGPNPLLDPDAGLLFQGTRYTEDSQVNAQANLLTPLPGDFNFAWTFDDASFNCNTIVVTIDASSIPGQTVEIYPDLPPGQVIVANDLFNRNPDTGLYLVRVRIDAVGDTFTDSCYHDFSVDYVRNVGDISQVVQINNLQTQYLGFVNEPLTVDATSQPNNAVRVESALSEVGADLSVSLAFNNDAARQNHTVVKLPFWFSFEDPPNVQYGSYFLRHGAFGDPGDVVTVKLNDTPVTDYVIGTDPEPFERYGPFNKTTLAEDPEFKREAEYRHTVNNPDFIDLTLWRTIVPVEVYNNNNAIGTTSGIDMSSVNILAWNPPYDTFGDSFVPATPNGFLEVNDTTNNGLLFRIQFTYTSWTPIWQERQAWSPGTYINDSRKWLPPFNIKFEGDLTVYNTWGRAKFDIIEQPLGNPVGHRMENNRHQDGLNMGVQTIPWEVINIINTGQNQCLVQIYCRRTPGESAPMKVHEIITLN